MMNHHNNSSQQSNATFYSQTSNSSSSSSSTRSGGGGGIDRVFNSLGNITQDGYDLEQRMHQYQQQHKHDKKQITTYDKRIKNFEKTLFAMVMVGKIVTITMKFQPIILETIIHN